MENYGAFIQQKTTINIPTGIGHADTLDYNPIMFPFQHDIVKWALKRGRACIWSGCGTGKTIMELEWARHVSEYTDKPVLIFAPLAVSEQTANEEAPKFNYDCRIVSCQKEARKGINITNYEKMEKFDLDQFGGVVLDEAGIIKHQTGKIRNMIIDRTKNVSFRLGCTATPAPNDFMEIGNHAEFVGAMKYREMLSMFFVHDGGNTAKWRLKGHAKKAFFKWVAQWAVVLRKPSDLGYSDDGFELPELRVHQVVTETEAQDGFLFPVEACTLQERLGARRDTVHDRVKAACRIIEKNKSEKNRLWCVWCNLNVEAESMQKARHGMINIQGSDSNEVKTERLLGFSRGEIDEIVSKSKIAGFGMNMQNCHNTIFLGLSDSYEQYYQAVRRFWRFGQKEVVNVYIVTSDIDGNVRDNIERKERDAETIYNEMVYYMKEINAENIKGSQRTASDYQPKEKIMVPSFI